MNTNDKGNIATTKVIADLAVKNWHVFAPITEHCVVDLVAVKDKQTIRLQVKYSTEGKVRNGSITYSTSGYKFSQYNIDDFDYYAMYLPNVDTVVYVPSEFGVTSIRTTIPQGKHEYYWYEDFRDFRPIIAKRKGTQISPGLQARLIEMGQQSSKIPDRETLLELSKTHTNVAIGKIYSVSDRTVGVWKRKYLI